VFLLGSSVVLFTSSNLSNTLSGGLSWAPSLLSEPSFVASTFFLNGNGTVFFVCPPSGFGGSEMGKIVGWEMTVVVSSSSPSSGDEVSWRLAYLAPSGDREAGLLRGVKTMWVQV